MQKYLASLAAAATVAALGASDAFADGLPTHAAAPVYHAPASDCAGAKFGGTYIGVHAGRGTMTSTLTDFDNFVDRASVQRNENGYTVGGQIGHNWTRCNMVFGIEGDVSYIDFNSNVKYDRGAETVHRSADRLASVRTRTGVAVSDLFIYATGGIAFANIDTSYSFTNVGSFKIDGTRTGWVAGLGTEYAFSDHMRITGDVLHYDFGTRSEQIKPAFGSQAFNFDDHHSLWVARIGLNFKLGH
jgi:outer membrane immunogenic protein